LIVEISGAPGSGKTTLLCKVREYFARDSYVKIIDWKRNKWFLDLKFLIWGGVSFGIEEWSIIRACNDIMKSSSKIPIIHRMNILRNCIKKLSVAKILKGKNKIFFIDEGTWHIPYSIFVDGNSEIVDRSQIESFLELLPMVDTLVIVKTNNLDELVNRILRRKEHRRIDFSSLYKVKNFLIQSLQVQEIICEFWKKKNKEVIEIYNTSTFEDFYLKIKNVVYLLNHERELKC